MTATCFIRCVKLVNIFISEAESLSELIPNDY